MKNDADAPFVDTQKWFTACHEAGHLTIGMHLLGDGRCQIEPVLHGGIVVEWVGSTTGKPIATREQIQLIAIAGPCAQYRADSPLSSDAECAAGIRHEKYGSTDRQYFPPCQRELSSLVHTVTNILGKHRRFFEWSVGELMRADQITSDEATKEFRVPQ